MFDMKLPTCSQAEKGAWHHVWSDFGRFRDFPQTRHDMILLTCSRAEKGAWHLVWSDLGVLRRKRAGMVLKGRKRVFKGADGRGW